MKKIQFVFYFFIFLIVSCSEKIDGVVSYVDPFIGTGGHGHTFPGATVPFGMVQLSPDQRTDGWDWCSGYHYSDNTIMGFSHTHLSGTGVGDLGDILLMPTVGKLQFEAGSIEKPDEGYRSRFSHKNEKASAGYYQVLLDDYNVNVELTTTARAGMHRYTFPETNEANVIIDLQHGIQDQTQELRLSFVSDTEIAGLRRSKGWAENQYVYFVAQFSKPFEKYGVVMDNKLLDGEKNAEAEKGVKAYVRFTTESDEQILVRVGISAVSIEGARNNLETEIKSWDFDAIHKLAEEAWNKELSKIEVEGGTEQQKRIFYTALYHTMIHPSLYTDADGKYRGRDGEVHEATDFVNYSIFSLWDTFRGAHPLYAIIDPARVNDFIKTFDNQYNQAKRLPVWELAACETNCMIGNHSISVIADAFAKGIISLGETQLLDAMVNTSNMEHFGLKSYKEHGFVKVEDEGESVSKTLEYAYDDWCIAQVAKMMGNDSVYNQFIERAQSYKNIFDPATGFMRGKINSVWQTPFDPREVNFNYTEGNAWQYSFFVPQDISGLMEMHGGKEKFVQKLDQLFTEKSETTGREQADITGLIGQYAHGNEPSHHMAYLYNYASEAWKTQKQVNQILTTMYTDKADGYIGNEDCGQMSAWYVLSAMGFYPVTPGTDIYAIGSPLFSKITIHLPDNKTFTIIANHRTTENYYILGAAKDGKDYDKCFIQHADIASGGSIAFDMVSSPNKNWGSAEGFIPVSKIDDPLFVPVPFAQMVSRTFFKELNIGLQCVDGNAKIYYTLDGSIPTEASMLYTDSITVSQNTVLNAVAIREGNSSKVMKAEVFKIPEGRKISIASKYSSQYTAGGDIALIDYMRGSANFKTGFWQGYSGQNIEVTVDLGKQMSVKKLAAGFIQDEYSWVFMPDSVGFFASNDGKTFTKVGLVVNDVPNNQGGVLVKEFAVSVSQRSKFVKLIAYTTGKCPSWHKGAGGDLWLFIDEFVIE